MLKKNRRRFGAHSRLTAREESSKPTAAYLGARAPAEAAPARGARQRPGCMCNGVIPGCRTLLRAITNHAMPYEDRFENRLPAEG